MLVSESGGSGGTGGLVVIGTSPTTKEVLVRDTSTGNLSWKPGTDQQIAEATGVINSGESYNKPYQDPSLTKAPTTSTGLSGSSTTNKPAYEMIGGQFYYNPDNTAGLSNISNMPVNPNYQAPSLTRTGGHEVTEPDLTPVTGGGSGGSGGGSLVGSAETIPAYELIDGKFYYNPDNTAGIANINNMPVNPGKTSLTKYTPTPVQAAPATEEITPAVQEAAVAKLQKYEVAAGAYNINKFLAEAENKDQAIQTLREAGFSQEVIAKAQGAAEELKTFEADEEKRKAAEIELKEYSDGSGNYNINEYLLEAKSPGHALQVLRDAGFTQDQIKAATMENLRLANEARQKVQDEHSLLGTVKYSANMVAEMVIPGLSTVRNWDNLSGWEKVIYPALDVVTLVPVVGLAAKGVGAGVRSVSAGAKIAALGGREAVQLAAKDAATSLSQAYVKREAQKALLEATIDGVKMTENIGMKKVYQNAAKAAGKDLALMDKQIAGLEKNVTTLNKLAGQAKTIEASETAGAKLTRVTERVEKGVTSKRAEVINKAGAVGISGVTTYSTVANWNELTPTQRAAGVALAMLPVGGFGKARNLAENALDPSKIPAKAIVPRTLSKRVEAGKVEVFNPTGDNTLRLKFSDASVIKDGDYQAARKVAQDIMDQATKGEKIAKGNLAGQEVKLKGTGFQETVSQGGHTAVSGSPTGEVFKQGTGAFGVKTNLEKYLEKVNQKLDKPIEITSKKYKAPNPETGALEDVTVTTKSSPGVTVRGSEGGLYLGPGLHTRFVRQSAAGIKGGISSGVILGYPDIEKLPRSVAKKALAGNEMREAAIKYFDGAQGSGQVVEGFKKFGRIVELENVATNGSQIKRVQNLRSRLADKLKAGSGEYYTRDSGGRVELFQMYLEGGRSTPYTLKEIYTLKGNALRNSLVDLGVGLKNKVKDLGKRKASVKETDITTKEEMVADAFTKIDQDAKAGRIPKDRVQDLKREAIDEIRYKESARPRFSGMAERRVGTRPDQAYDYETLRSGDERYINEDLTRPAAETRTRTGGEVLTRSERTAEPARSAERTGTERPANERAPESRTQEERPTNERTEPERPGPERNQPERPETERPPRERPERPEETKQPPIRPEPPRTMARPGEPNTEGGKPIGKLDLPDIKIEPADRLEYPKGTKAWRQGIGWWVWKPPYQEKDREFVLSKPHGAEISVDAKTAIGTVQSFGGNAPIDNSFDMGIVDVKLKDPPVRPNKVKGRRALKFTRDPEDVYKGKSGSKRIGPYHYKGGALSRKKL